MPTLNVRNYIITSPSLASMAQRRSKTLSFYGLVLEVTKRFVALDEATMHIIKNNMDGTEGHHGLMPESHAATTKLLQPGPELDSMCTIQLEQFSQLLHKTASTSNGQPVALHSWIRQLFSISNAYAVYGPQNPFARDPSLIKAFWDFEEGMVDLAASPYPALTARKAFAAREKLLGALIDYVEEERYASASTVIKTRIGLNLKHGLSKTMAGHAELIMLFGILSNAVPTTFWMLSYIFNRPDLLAELRTELQRVVSQEGESNTHIIHVHQLKTECPLLVSTFRETMRVIGNLSSVRYVVEDTWLADQYLLKKGSVIQIPSGIMHLDTNTWGSDAAEFKPTRFLEEISVTTTTHDDHECEATQRKAVPRPKNVPASAYRAFGGGSVICPGRHYGQTEILGFVAAVLLMFDMTNADGSMPVTLPAKDECRIPLSVMKPVEDVRVCIRLREGMESVKWDLQL